MPPQPGTAARPHPRGHQLRVRFAGGAICGHPARSRPSPRGEVLQLPARRNDPARWAHGVPGYRQVRYQAPVARHRGPLLRECHGSTWSTTSRWRPAPTPAVGAAEATRAPASLQPEPPTASLHVGTTVGELTELAPHAYQTRPGQRPAPASSLPLPPRCGRGDSSVTFALGPYDHRRPLVHRPHGGVFDLFGGAQGRATGASRPPTTRRAICTRAASCWPMG